MFLGVALHGPMRDMLYFDLLPISIFRWTISDNHVLTASSFTQETQDEALYTSHTHAQKCAASIEFCIFYEFGRDQTLQRKGTDKATDRFGYQDKDEWLAVCDCQRHKHDVGMSKGSWLTVRFNALKMAAHFID